MARYQIDPFTFDLHVGLIHSPGRSSGSFVFLGCRRDQGRIVDQHRDTPFFPDVTPWGSAVTNDYC